MPILTGFPPSNTLAPGVLITEKDFSFIDSVPSVHACGLVGFATKGPVNVPTLIQSGRQLHTTFGFPRPDEADPYLIYAAEQYLQFANGLYIVRVAETRPVYDYAAATAEVEIPASGGAVNIIGNEVGDFTFADDQFLQYKLNGVLSSKVLTVLAGTYTAAELAADLNDQLNPEDGVEFSATDDETLKMSSTFSFGTAASIELVSIQNALYGPDSIVGMGTTMTAASVTGSVTKYPNNSYQSAGNYDLSSFTNLYLNVVIDGTENVNIDNVVQKVLIPTTDTTDSDIADYINAQIDAATIPGGFEASVVGNAIKLTTLHHGRDAVIIVKSSSTADALLGLDNITHRGTSPSAVSNQDSDATYAAGIVTGSADGDGLVSFTVTADSPGTAGNLTQVVIANDVREGTFSIQVYNDGEQVETWGGLVKDQSDRHYVETFMALLSDYIRVVDNTDTLVTPLAGTYDLAGGSNGIPTDPDDQDDLLIGSDAGLTGMYALSEPEQVDIDLFAIPGHSSTAVILAGLDLCQNKRQDCMMIVDPPFGLLVNEVVQWINGQHPLNTTRFDNDFGAVYWPWLKIRDTFNGIDVWVPPSTCIVATWVNSDNISFPWFAPAGETRGTVFNVLEAYSKPTKEELDTMYGNRNCVNPIVMHADLDNYTVWGQKTMQRRPTALDRINVRRTMLYVEKLIRRATRRLLFEPHDENLRAQFISLAKGVLESVQRDRGINDFKIKCDTELNTPDVIDRNELRAKIGIQPSRAAEFIFIEFSIHRTGSFTENADSF